MEDEDGVSSLSTLSDNDNVTNLCAASFPMSSNFDSNSATRLSAIATFVAINHVELELHLFQFTILGTLEL